MKGQVTLNLQEYLYEVRELGIDIQYIDGILSYFNGFQFREACLFDEEPAMNITDRWIEEVKGYEKSELLRELNAQ